MAAQHQGGHESVQDDGRDGTKSKCMAHEDKAWAIITWRSHKGVKVRTQNK